MIKGSLHNEAICSLLMGHPPPFLFHHGNGGPAQPKAAAAHHSQDLFLFDFGKGPAEKDYVKVNESSVYQNGAGYGFSQAGSAVCKKTQKKKRSKKTIVS